MYQSSEFGVHALAREPSFHQHFQGRGMYTSLRALRANVTRSAQAPVGSFGTQLGMLGGTSPSLAAIAATNAWQLAFQANTTNLWVVGTQDNRGDMGLGMMTNTSPSIAMTQASWQVAFQANTSNLWIVGTQDNRGDMGLGMMTNTSPSIAVSAGGWQSAFQANTGNLWIVGTIDNRGDMGLGMMAGTSPCVAIAPDGRWIAAFQANTGNLWIVGTIDNRGDMGLGMMAGTSPSISVSPGGGWQVAFQANTGNLWIVGTLDNRGDMGLGMKAGSSPSIVTFANRWQAAFQANTGNLWVVGTASSPGDLGQPLQGVTSPAIAAVANGDWDVACQASTTELVLCGSQRNLNLVEQHQSQNEWCWAASTASITLFYNPASTWTQCSLANRAFGQTTCCTDGGTAACNQPWYPDQALTITGHLASTSNGKPTLATVINEINAGHPISVNIQWTGGGGHNPVVDGYDCSQPTGATIDLQDPWYGHSVQEFGSFPASYQGGARWAVSYLTR
jgi:hypothetical protein